MGLNLSTRLKVAFEKARYYLSGYEPTPLISFWYLTDPDKCVSRDPAYQYETLAAAMGSVGLLAFYEDIDADIGIIYPDNTIKKANGHPANQIIAKLDPTTRLAILSFIGARHEMHAVFKRPLTGDGRWHLDTFSLEENGGFFTLDCGRGSASLPFVARGLDAFNTAVAITLLDPQSREQDADIELGKIVREDLDALYTRFQKAPATLAPR
jgi:hypothetical protein